MQPSINTKSIISPKCSFLQYTNPEKKKKVEESHLYRLSFFLL